MSAERAIVVVVLSMDVGRDRSAYRYLAGARGHRHEPALRDAAPHQLVEGDAGSDADLSVGVYGLDAIDVLGFEHQTADVLSRVSI